MPSYDDFQADNGAHLFDVPVRNTSGSAIAAFAVLTIDPTKPWSNTGPVGVTPSTDDDTPYAVALEPIPDGRAGVARRLGHVRVIAGDAITTGDTVMPTAGGKVLTQTTGKPSLGVALMDAAADGDWLIVDLMPSRNG